MPVPHPQAYYSHAVSTLTLKPPPSCLAIEGPRQPEGPKFTMPKEIKILPPKPSETLVGLKTNKFGDVTCMKYKSSRLAFDGVWAMPNQINVIPPWKRSSSSSDSSVLKRPRATLASLEKKIEDLTQIVAKMQKDLVSLAGAVERLAMRVDKAAIKHQGFKSHVNIISRIVANRLEN
jgi:hypothetical protein